MTRPALAVAVLLAAALSAPVPARASLLAEVERVATRYHEDPARLDAVRERLEQAVREGPDAATLTALSRISFVWGDVRASSGAERLAAYARGREAGRRALELEPGSVLARLWYAINTARWGQAKGVLRSLFLLPALREEIRILLELAPEVAAVHALAGNVDLEVPGALGGDVARAETRFRQGLRLDPNFTGIRVGLAKVLIKQRRFAEARRELGAVLEATAPSNAADWTLKDVPEARTLLAALGGR